MSSNDPHFSKVVLLLHCEGANGSTTLTDTSLNPKTVTATSPAALSTSASKFGASSLLVDGSSYVTVTDHADFTFAGDITVEMWIRWSSDLTSTARFLELIGSTFGLELFRNSAEKIVFATDVSGASTARITGTTTVTNGTFHHVALVRSGGVFKLFLDGVQEGGTYSDSSTVNPTDIRVGFNNAITAQDIYIDEVRFTNGLSRYSSTFTPAVEAFGDNVASNLTLTCTPASTVNYTDPTGIYTQFTQLLLHFTGADGDIETTDSSPINRYVTFNDTAQISTAQSKFGASSLYLGTHGRIHTSSSGSYGLSGDWTFEGWVYFAALPTTAYTVFKLTEDLNSNFVSAEVSPTGKILVKKLSNTITGTITVPTSTWVHVAVVRKNGTDTLYVDGIADGSFSDSFAFTTDSVTLGVYSEVGLYIDEFRVLKKKAAYTADFTPRTTAFIAAAAAHSLVGNVPVSVSSSSTLVKKYMHNSIYGSGAIATVPSATMTYTPNPITFIYGVGGGFKSEVNRSSWTGAGRGFKSIAAGTMDYGNVGEGVGNGFNSIVTGLGGAVGAGTGFNSTVAGVMLTPEYWYGKGYGFSSTAAGVLNVTVLMTGKGAGFRSTPAGLGGATGLGYGFSSSVAGTMLNPELMTGKGGGFYSTARGTAQIHALATGKGGGFSSTVWHATGQGGSFTSTVSGKFLSTLINSQAFVMNMTPNSAGQYPVTRFTNYPFDNIVKLGANYYGVKDDGFYLLAGDSDITTAVNGKITLKDTDFGVYQEKRLQYVYLNTDTVTTTVPFVNGVQKPGVASLFGGRRCKLPLGDKGRYWQLRIENIKKLEGIEFNPVGVQRKV